MHIYTNLCSICSYFIELCIEVTRLIISLYAFTYCLAITIRFINYQTSGNSMEQLVHAIVSIESEKHLLLLYHPHLTVLQHGIIAIRPLSNPL